jgi:plasmid replication initiation protein
MSNILIILFFLTTLNTISQVLLKIKAHFNMSSNLNFKDLKNNEEVVLNKIFNFSNKDKSGLFVLEFNKNESLFYGEKKAKEK